MSKEPRTSITNQVDFIGKRAQWEAIQKQTFTRWANQYLLDRMLEMKNLYDDIGDGLLLGNLAEVISNKKVLTKMAKNPRFKMQKLENLGIVLGFFESEGLKFINVDPDALLTGQNKLALGFMWTIILRYAINRGDGEGGKSARAEILDWMAEVSQEPCKNFGCLRDGRILSKIVNHCSQLKGLGDLIDDPNALDRSQGFANNDAAIHTAHDRLDVPMLVDADVFDTDTPEELSSMTYISCYRQLEARLKDGTEPKVEAAPAEPTATVDTDGNIAKRPVFVDVIGQLPGGEAADPADCSYRVTDSNGNDVPIADNGTFTPAAPGMYTVTPVVLGTALAQHATTVDVGEPLLTAEIDVPTTAIVGEPITAYILLLNEGDPMSEGGETVAVNDAPATDNDDGTYSIILTPETPGELVVTVSDKKGKWLCKAVHVEVSAATASLRLDPESASPCVAKHAVVVQGHFVDGKGEPRTDESDEPLVVEVTEAETGTSVPCVVKKLDDHSGVTVAFTPVCAGTYTLTPAGDGDAVEVAVADAELTATLDVPSVGTAGSPLKAVVTLSNAGDPMTDGGETVLVNGEAADDNGDGTYTATITPDAGGDFVVTATNGDGAELCEPVHVQVEAVEPTLKLDGEAAQPCFAKRAVTIPGIFVDHAGRSTTVEGDDAPEVTVTDANGDAVTPVKVVKSDDNSSVSATFKPRKSGVYTVTPATGDPITVSVGEPVVVGRLEGKTALVTAAGQGIGRAAAVAMAEQGATVIATDINMEALASLDDVDGVTTARLDVLDSDAVKAVMATLPDGVDVLFNCAGFVHHGGVLEATEKEFDFAFNLNVKSMFRLMQCVLPGMIERRSGSIINMASVASSIKGVENRFLYGASKAAVIGMTRAAAADVVQHNVRVNSICPGTIDTPSLQGRINAQPNPDEARANFISRQKMGRLGTATEIAKLVVYLASDESSYTTGTEHIIDGGWSI